MRSKLGTPLSPQATASPSMMQDREAKAGKSLSDQREAASRVIVGAAVEPHVVAILAGDNPEAIVLDFVQPLVAGGQLVGPCGKARRDESGREGTLQHVG